jgi:hypothetical protein
MRLKVHRKLWKCATGCKPQKPRGVKLLDREWFWVKKTSKTMDFGNDFLLIGLEGSGVRGLKEMYADHSLNHNILASYRIFHFQRNLFNFLSVFPQLPPLSRPWICCARVSTVQSQSKGSSKVVNVQLIFKRSLSTAVLCMFKGCSKAVQRCSKNCIKDVQWVLNGYSEGVQSCIKCVQLMFNASSISEFEDFPMDV